MAGVVGLLLGGGRVLLLGLVRELLLWLLLLGELLLLSLLGLAVLVRVGPVLVPVGLRSLAPLLLGQDRSGSHRC